MTSVNPFAALKSLLPDSPVLVGRVLAHNADDTSTISLPANLAPTYYADNVATGSVIQARGRTVAVGQNAFVRDGVVESQAPDEDALEIEVGTTVVVPPDLSFSGTVPGDEFFVGDPFTLDLTPYWAGGLPPLSYAVASGPLPPGVTLNEVTGIVTGPSTAPGVYLVVFAGVDGGEHEVESNAVTLTSTAVPVLFSGPILNIDAEIDVPFTVDLSTYWSGGYGALSYSVSAGTLPAGLSLNASTGVLSGTPTEEAVATISVRATDTIGAFDDSNVFDLAVVLGGGAVGSLIVGHESTANNLWVSNDSGVTWENRGVLNAANTRFTWATDQFFAVARGSSVSNVKTSEDGITWGTKTLPTARERDGVAANGGTVVVLNVVSSSAHPRITVSYDWGVSWADVALLPTGDFSRSVSWVGDRFVVATAVAARHSVDAVSWSNVTMPTGSHFVPKFIKFGSLFIFVNAGAAMTTFHTSPDLLTWTSRALPSSVVFGSIDSLASNGVALVATSSTGLYTSTDGLSFTLTYSAAAAYNRTSVYWDGSKFVAMHDLEVLHSVDGHTWTLVATRAFPSFGMFGVAA